MASNCEDESAFKAVTSLLRSVRPEPTTLIEVTMTGRSMHSGKNRLLKELTRLSNTDSRESQETIHAKSNKVDV